MKEYQTLPPPSTRRCVGDLVDAKLAQLAAGVRIIHNCRPSRPQEGVVTQVMSDGLPIIRFDDGSLLCAMACCRIEVIG